ncbi:ABC transporter permease [Candidatus Chloroploca sp. Khr17]|uniref:ABC transporter permease n=1 Tax=Candidatus Chloroploca sp. Khr17 TaxID=2496869 RepID=UPI00101CB500|nr:ABC transporter permease [Candidatus Chloroploca sp. Khr17]
MIELLGEAYAYYLANQTRFWTEFGRHLTLSGTALGISMLLCLPLGIWAARHAASAQYLINAVGAMRLIPSLAILFLAQPYLGTGFTPALIALTVLALPPILINVYAGLLGVERAIVEAAQGMGMTVQQQLLQIELPLALPVILAGIRIAAVEVISSATLAAFIGAGGLGIFITRGFALFEPRIMLVGAVPIALLALGSDLLLGQAERWATSYRS